jgi:hypothetical protein
MLAIVATFCVVTIIAAIAAVLGIPIRDITRDAIIGFLALAGGAAITYFVGKSK